MYTGGRIILSDSQKAARTGSQFLIEDAFNVDEGAGSLIHTLTESIGSGKIRTKIIGNCLECDVEGINRRIYRRTTMARESQRFTDLYIRGGMAWGEMNHPILSKDGFGVTPATDINMMKASHYIEEMWMDGSFLKMKARIVETMPAGAVAKAVIDEGLPLHVSIRGQGPTEQVGKKTFVSDIYRLITVDLVGRPSFGAVATMESIVEAIYSNKVPLLTESVEMAVHEFMDEVDSMVRHNTKKELANITVGKLMDAIGGDE
jgi:hypothetical protein